MRSNVVVVGMIGALTGAAIGAVEAAWRLAGQPAWMLEAGAIGVAMLDYGAIGMALAGLWSLTARGVSPADLPRRAVGSTLVGLSALVGGYWINRRVLPELDTGSSLAFNAVALIGAGLALAWLRRPSRDPASAGSRLWEAAGGILACLAIGAVSMALPRVWHRLHRPGAGQDARPNVLLIVMDTTRADRLSCYGYDRPTTPNIDRLAADGVLFEAASSAAPWTLPSHASLFTGLYLSQHMVDRTTPKMSEQLYTLAEALRDHGYQTAGFSNNPWISRATNFDQGFEVFEDQPAGGRPIHALTIRRLLDRLRQLAPGGDDHHAAQTNRYVTDWFNQVRDPARPFFIFINYVEPHFIYHPPEPYRSRFLTVPATLDQRALRKMRRLPPPVAFDPATHQQLSDLYDGEIAYLDMRVGQVVDALARRGVLDRTVVVVTSDHGESLGEHKMFQHMFSLHQVLLHVPLVMRYPGRFPRGARIAEPIQHVDLFPTLLELAGVPHASIPEPLVGVSLLGPGGIVTHPRPIFAEWTDPSALLPQYAEKGPVPDERYFRRSLQSFRVGGDKLIWSSDGAHELYDLTADPREETNLAAQQPHAVETLASQLHAHVGRLTHVVDPAAVTLDRETMSRLKALGYVQ